MTQVKAQLKHLREAPRKVRLVADVMRGQKASAAYRNLRFTSKRPAKALIKLLNSAIANARSNYNMDSDSLYVKEIRVDGGPVLKRYMPKARGAAHMIKKRTSHITLILSEIQNQKKPETINS